MGGVISLANNSTYYHVPNTFQRQKENWAKLVDIESLDQMLDKIPEFSVLRDSNIIHMLANMWIMFLAASQISPLAHQDKTSQIFMQWLRLLSCDSNLPRTPRRPQVHNPIAPAQASDDGPSLRSSKSWPLLCPNEFRSQLNKGLHWRNWIPDSSHAQLLLVFLLLICVHEYYSLGFY